MLMFLHLHMLLHKATLDGLDVHPDTLLEKRPARHQPIVCGIAHSSLMLQSIKLIIHSEAVL